MEIPGERFRLFGWLGCSANLLLLSWAPETAMQFMQASSSTKAATGLALCFDPPRLIRLRLRTWQIAGGHGGEFPLSRRSLATLFGFASLSDSPSIYTILGGAMAVLGTIIVAHWERFHNGLHKITHCLGHAGRAGAALSVAPSPRDLLRRTKGREHQVAKPGPHQIRPRVPNPPVLRRVRAGPSRRASKSAYSHRPRVPRGLSTDINSARALSWASLIDLAIGRTFAITSVAEISLNIMGSATLKTKSGIFSILRFRSFPDKLSPGWPS